MIKKYKLTVKSIYNIFLSIVFSVCIVFMTRIHFSGSVWGTVEENYNYIDEIGISAIPLFLVCFMVLLIATFQVELIMRKIIKRLCPVEETKENSMKIIMFWGILIMVSWLPYYLTYYPGGIFADTLSSISYYPDRLTNRHPLLYNYLIGLAIKFGNYFNKDLAWSMGLFLAVQMILLECEIIYFLYWMITHHINRWLRTCAMLYMAFFTLIPLYAISIWKDTPFCMAFMLWFMFFVDMYLNVQKNQWDFKIFLGFIAGVFLVAFTRNNGIYVIIFSVIILVITTLKNKYEKKRLIYIIAILSVILIIFIQGPVYRWMGVEQTEITENLGVPLQQIGRVVACDGVITKEQKEKINLLIPYGNIKEHYSPCMADDLKFYSGLDVEYLSENMDEFWDLWVHLFMQNPKLYLEAYLLETVGFWNVDAVGSAGYVQNFIWNNEYGISQTDYFEKWFGFSFQRFVDPRNYLSSACFFWIFLTCTIFIMKQYGWGKICLFAPQLGVWLTLMIATPIAISLRYISPLMFTLPFVVIVPVLLEN